MEEVDPLKETLILGALNVILPTVDVYSDLALVTKLYLHENKHYIWGSNLLIPFLINYTLCWFAWFTTDKQKKFAWIAALLGCYPQLVAAKIIWMFWKEPRKGMKEKRHFERNLMENEIFTEAVPSALIMTFLMVVNINCLIDGVCGGNHHQSFGDSIFGENGSLDVYLFFVSFTTSVLSAGLGLAKCLKVGLGASHISLNCIMILILKPSLNGNDV